MSAVSAWTKAGAEGMTPEAQDEANVIASVPCALALPVNGAVRETSLPIGLTWLLRLRWFAVVGQLSMLGVARWAFDLDLPWASMLSLVGLTAATNALLATGHPQRFGRHAVLSTVVVFDVLVLSALLGFAGGAANPLSVFFVVHVALAALLLRPAAVWSVVALTVLAFGALFFVPSSSVAPFAMHEGHSALPSAALGVHDGAPGIAHVHSHAVGHVEHLTSAMNALHAAHAGAGSLHLLGMWGAYALSACLVAYFIRKITEAIGERDRKLAEAQRAAQRTERLAILSAFSAQAAHELATPLGTIGLAAKELARAVSRGAKSDELTSDAELIRTEVARCRGILADISSRAGQSVGEMPVETTPREVVDAVMTNLAKERLAVVFEGREVESHRMRLPRVTLVQMLVNLLRNACDANRQARVDAPVELRIAFARTNARTDRASRDAHGGHEHHDEVHFHVLDGGAGFSEEVRARVGEPFVTTKRETGGLGLGVYLVQAFAARVGGALRYRARESGGLEARLALPVDGVWETRRPA